MILEGWPEYMPPPGSRYVIHYVPEDGHGSTPDLRSLERALDARPSVSVKDVQPEGDNGFRADVIIWVGDMALFQILGRFLCAGPCWLIESVERTDDGALGGISVTLGKLTDAVLDPVQDFTSAASEAARQTVSDVKRVGAPSLAIIVVAVIAFLVAREL